MTDLAWIFEDFGAGLSTAWKWTSGAFAEGRAAAGHVLAEAAAFDTHGWVLVAAAIAGIAIFAAALFRLARRATGQHGAGPAPTLTALTRFPRQLGIAATVVFASVFGLWAGFAPLSSATVAHGIITPDGHRKTVQHLEGGIIRTINVREGDIVAAGDPLVTLDDTAAQSMDAQIRERFLHVSAREARLKAEQAGLSAIEFPDALRENRAPEVRRLMEDQEKLLASRLATHRGRTLTLEARIRQLDEQNAGLRDLVVAQDEQIALIEEEIETSDLLLQKGLSVKSRMLERKRARAEIVGQRAATRAKIAENAQAVGETRLQLLTLTKERQEAVESELAEVSRILAELRGQLPSREDILRRTVIRAPIAGTVMNVRVTTEGGVIGPGAPILEIVPADANLVIDARVRPTDIERIVPGMSARVVLTAFRQRNLPQIHGNLRSVSADSLIDDRTGEHYFLAKVELADSEIAQLDGVELLAGMPAEVMILDGERTLLAYLFRPILESSRRSLLEN